MFDPRLVSPESPVDSAMFPPVYNRSTSSSSTASMSSCPDLQQQQQQQQQQQAPADLPVKPAPTAGVFGLKQQSPAGGSFRSELEPFEFRPNRSAVPTPRTQAGTSLSSVFGDQDLIDAIMCSLNTEQAAASNLNVAIPVLSPLAFSMPRRMQQQLQVPQPTSFTALMQQRPHAMPLIGTTGRPVMNGPCLRKPGTFLNKDGRWIKGKPCRMEGCDKRAQSNGLCKGHGGGARCSFTGCSKSSQGGGFCRAHGGGKRCMHEGCEKGTQRNGFCYLHGGVRSCSVEGCDKKDRGNGKCFSHGGGRKCQAHMCFNTIRRGAFCDLHNGKLAK